MGDEDLDVLAEVLIRCSHVWGGLRALSTEREIDMLLLLADALRRYPAPRMLYVGRVDDRRGDDSRPRATSGTSGPSQI